MISLLFFLFCTSMTGPVLADDNLVRAKIGIKIESRGSQRMARASDRIRSGDMVRIYAHPEKAAYIYVIYTDKKQVTLLTIVEQTIQGSTLVLPSVDEYYEIDGSSRTEIFTIICSPTALKQIPALIQSNDSHEKWAALENELKDKSKINLTQKSELPFSIAGNVRSAGPATGGRKILQDLKIYSGKHLVVKRYEFKVKK